VTITLRQATLDDLDILQRWDEQPHVLACDPHSDWNWHVELGREPEWREQWIAEWDGRPIGMVQIIDPAEEETHYWGNVPDHWRAIDIWIGEPNCLGRGFGTKIMRLAIERCFSNAHVEGILVDPLSNNDRAIRFYERLGFQFVEHRQFEDDHCAIYRLSRNRWIQVSASRNAS
jgi:aminoglycoside 6'-N-acetyltransferase